MKAKEFRQKARTALKGKWGTALITTLVASFLGAFGISTYTGSSSSSDNYEKVLESLKETEFGTFVLGALSVIVVIAGIWSIIKFIIGGSITLGYRKFTLEVVDNKEAVFKDLFSEMPTNFGKGFVLQLLISIFTTLWALLLVVPGIIKSYSYSMAPYILLEHPDYTPKQAIKESKQLMKGNKWRLFCLELSFIGWILLSIITCGIALLWINPYMQVAEAAFYRQIVAEKESTPSVA